MGDFIGWVAVDDYNCDNDLDIAVTVIGESRIAFLAGDGLRGFEPDGEIDLGDDGGFAMVTGDFTGEGSPDVAVGVFQLEQVWIFNHI